MLLAEAEAREAVCCGTLRTLQVAEAVEALFQQEVHDGILVEAVSFPLVNFPSISQ